MSVIIGHASIDEKGKARGGQAGDQTKREVVTREWYTKPWIAVLRPKRERVAKKIAEAMRQACANDNIGYDQNQRTTLYEQAKLNNWDLSKVNVKCETDCSALVSVCVNCAGVQVSKDMYTGNEKQVLLNTGEFTCLATLDYTNSSSKLKVGDVLLANGHTAIVLSNGSSVNTSKTPNSTYKKDITTIAKEVIAGKWGTGENRKKNLKKAGYDYDKVQKKVNELLK